jgi:hypothetical protein
MICAPSVDMCIGSRVISFHFMISSNYHVFPLSIYHSIVALQTHIWGMRNMQTQVGIHAWVLDPPHLKGKRNRNVGISKSRYLTANTWFGKKSGAI